MKNYSRRNFLGKFMAIPAGLWLTNYQAFSGSASVRNQVKITAIKAMNLDFLGDGCLIKIETDSGLIGYGEAGVNSTIARGQLQYITREATGLIGGDPLAIGRHFFRLSAPQNPLRISMGVISGIDIALWDLAGKILDQPIYNLLGGPFRNGCPMYSHTSALKDMMDPASCKEWAAYIKQQPEGFTLFKGGPPFEVQRPWHPVVSTSELKMLKQGFTNMRDAVGDSVDLALHCTGQFNTPSGISMANTLEDLNISFIEDPLNAVYSDGWLALKRGTRVRVLTGEKLETVKEFKPFLDEQAVDIIHPDISYAGGITGLMKIADYAAISRTPVATHNAGTLIRTYASAHFSMAIDNFYKSESRLGRPERMYEQMATEAPVIKNAILQVSDKPGLGFTIDEAFLKKHLPKDETWWG
jgi:L-alanine-DL-glutamate epimerase-like enolase superfamily enzyme